MITREAAKEFFPTTKWVAVCPACDHYRQSLEECPQEVPHGSFGYDLSYLNWKVARRISAPNHSSSVCYGYPLARESAEFGQFFDRHESEAYIFAKHWRKHVLKTSRGIFLTDHGQRISLMPLIAIDFAVPGDAKCNASRFIDLSIKVPLRTDWGLSAVVKV